MRIVVLWVMVAAGTAGFLYCMAYAWQDWEKLGPAYMAFERAAGGNSLQALVAAEARQNIHRINLFAEVVWALLCAIIAAISLNGLGRQK